MQIDLTRDELDIIGEALSEWWDIVDESESYQEANAVAAVALKITDAQLHFRH